MIHSHRTCRFKLIGPAKPTRPYKNQADARKSCLFATGLKTKWPCHLCNGRGRLYDPADHDVYEGYKMASRHVKCGNCAGAGDIGQTRWRAWYHAEMQAWKRDVRVWEEHKQKAEQAIAKLNTAELYALKVWRIQWVS